MVTYRPINGVNLPVGAPALFSCNGTGTVHAAQIAPRGPLGQFMVQFTEGEMAGELLAVGPMTEIVDIDCGGDR